MSIIKTEKLSYDYVRHDEEGNVEGTLRAVDDVNISVEPGQFIAILGHNLSLIHIWQWRSVLAVRV